MPRRQNVLYLRCRNHQTVTKLIGRNVIRAQTPIRFTRRYDPSPEYCQSRGRKATASTKSSTAATQREIRVFSVIQITIASSPRPRRGCFRGFRFYTSDVQPHFGVPQSGQEEGRCRSGSSSSPSYSHKGPGRGCAICMETIRVCAKTSGGSLRRAAPVWPRTFRIGAKFARG